MAPSSRTTLCQDLGNPSRGPRTRDRHFVGVWETWHEGPEFATGILSGSGPSDALAHNSWPALCLDLGNPTQGLRTCDRQSDTMARILELQQKCFRRTHLQASAFLQQYICAWVASHYMLKLRNYLAMMTTTSFSVRSGNRSVFVLTSVSFGSSSAPVQCYFDDISNSILFSSF